MGGNAQTLCYSTCSSSWHHLSSLTGFPSWTCLDTDSFWTLYLSYSQPTRQTLHMAQKSFNSLHNGSICNSFGKCAPFYPWRSLLSFTDTSFICKYNQPHLGNYRDLLALLTVRGLQCTAMYFHEYKKKDLWRYPFPNTKQCNVTVHITSLCIVK